MEREQKRDSKKGFSNKKSGNKKFKTTKPRTEEKPVSFNEPIRLNKCLSNAGICSRREADVLIKSGDVTINGEVVTELGTKVFPKDDVQYKGKTIIKEQKVYILLNKPKDVVTTVKDEHADKTVIDIVQNACSERVYPVGRLDKNTTGVLLLTNDGELTKQLTHPSFKKKKIYHVHLDKDLTKNDLLTVAKGLQIDEDFIAIDAIDFVDESDKSQVGIEIHSGQNRIVRRLFESIGYRVRKLDRVYFAGLTKKNLPRGKFRHLTPQEISMLKRKSFK
jgi:23S rRNA pseudouridine2605 synthase